MNKSKLATAGITVLAGAGILIAAPFKGKEDSKKGDNGKYKQYQVIHMEDGKMRELDTLIPMNSNYTVEDFLRDKKIEAENLDVIKIPAAGEMEDFFFIDKSNKGKKKHQKMIVESDIEFEEDNGSGEKVEIKVTVDKDGKMKAKKTVNGKEVEKSPEELEKIHKEHQAHGNQIIVKVDKMDDLLPNKEHEKEAEMIVKIDDDGKMEVKKIVNGKEVELSEEELEQIKEQHEKLGDHHGDHMVFEIEVDEEADGNAPKELMEKIHLELGELDWDFEVDENMNHDSLLKVIHEKIEKLHGDLGEMKVIVKELNIDEEDDGEHQEQKVVMINNGKKTEWHSKDGNTVFVDVDGASEEDFTIVIVKEGVDKKEAEKPDQITDRELDFKIYPNPTNGVFNVSFLLNKKANTNLEVLDLQGKKVYTEDLGKVEGRIQKEIDLSKNRPGVYILNVFSGKEKLSKRVVVK